MLGGWVGSWLDFFMLLKLQRLGVRNRFGTWGIVSRDEPASGSAPLVVSSLRPTPQLCLRLLVAEELALVSID